MAELPGGPLTILFSDVEGSTDLRTERGDAAAHRILRSHEHVVRHCVAEHGGREIKALGDGFMVVFVSPRTALECSVAIQQELQERNVECPGDEVKVRIGINTGEVTVEGDDIYGQAVNAAARIAGRAKGGEILVSEIVRQLAGSGPEFTFVDRQSSPTPTDSMAAANCSPEGTSSEPPTTGRTARAARRRGRSRECAPSPSRPGRCRSAGRRR